MDFIMNIIFLLLLLKKFILSQFIQRHLFDEISILIYLFEVIYPQSRKHLL